MRGERARLGECLAACGALVGTGARVRPKMRGQCAGRSECLAACGALVGTSARVRPKMDGERAGTDECLAACGALMTSRSLHCNMRLSVLFVLQLFALASATFVPVRGFRSPSISSPLALGFRKRSVHPILWHADSHQVFPSMITSCWQRLKRFQLDPYRAPLRVLDRFCSFDHCRRETGGEERNLDCRWRAMGRESLRQALYSRPWRRQTTRSTQSVPYT